MDENRFSEHHRINQYLKKRSMRIPKSKTITKHSNQLSNFPIGLLIITNEGFNEEKLEFINQYACRLFKVKESVEINTLKKKFSEYTKLKKNYTTKTSLSLNDIIFNSNIYNLEMDNFIAFESTHSKTSILYIKINEVENQKYVVIDKYDKYIDEKKYIELNLIKNINYQYLHTLYHELNNPLNALLAISGENKKFEQTEIGGSRIYEKNPILQKRSLNKKNRKDKKSGLLSLDSGKNKLYNGEIKDDTRSRKKSIDIPNYELNNISLLVNIIKVFIKNFILYLKIRADNLLSLKNEYEMQNDTSDIMNAVEVSEYERELTKHKLVKINLEYIFELYLNKYLCLFKYKEIEYDTNFEKLRNILVLTDEFNFSYYIRQIYTYLYYVVPKKDGFSFEYSFEKDKMKIMIKKRPYENLSRRTDLCHRISFKEDGFKMEQVIQTKEMTKEVLYSISQKLNFNIEIFDCENIDQNNYLYITLPIEYREESEENDDFKDEDINEMGDKDAIFFEEKLKRQLPSNSLNEGHKASNISTIQIMDMLSKSGEEMKLSIDSLISINKANMINNNLKVISSAYNSQKNSDNIIIFQDSQKKSSTIKISSNNSFLSKKLKEAEPKKTEKSKFLVNNISENNLLTKMNKKASNLRSVSSVEVKGSINSMEKSDKKEIVQKNTLKSLKSLKHNEIFTLINNNGYPEDINNVNDFLSGYSIDLIKNKKDEMTFKEQSAFVSGYASSIKNRNENRPSGIQLNNEKICSPTQNSSIITSFFGKRNQSKIRSSCFVSELVGENDNKNKTLEKNGMVLIELDKNKKSPNNIQNKMNTNISKKLGLGIIEEETEKKLKSSLCNNSSKKNGIPILDEQKGNYLTTIIDNTIKDNENLFVKAIKESKIHRRKTKQINEKSKTHSKSSHNKSHSKKYGSESDSDFLNSDEQCDCADILVVDDEEFNVMATQKMLKNLGYDSDAAYNGEECIKLINEKLKLNCKCNSHYYKLIFLDIVMPIMDGIATAKAIQEMIDKKIIGNQTKIIFISGNIDGSNLKNSLLEINCVKECLQKPVKINKYQKIIEKYYNDN